MPGRIWFQKNPGYKRCGSIIHEHGYTKTEDQALSMAESVEYRTPGEVKGFVMFPLNKAPMPPNLIMIYGTPAQMFRLASGLFYNFRIISSTIHRFYHQ
jgi:uncharacterized protein (DUF169 family)